MTQDWVTDWHFPIELSLKSLLLMLVILIPLLDRVGLVN